MYVKNVGHFVEHTKSHIENVAHIAEHLIDRIQENRGYQLAFSVPKGADLDSFKKKLLKGIEYHDAAKINAEPLGANEIGDALMEHVAHMRQEGHYAKGEEAFANQNMTMEGATLAMVLYQGYGSDGFPKMTDNVREEFLRVIDSVLNKKDEKIMTDYLEQTFETQWERGLFQEIENMADKIDRGMNPISREEFGRDMTPASDFLARSSETSDTFKGRKKLELVREAEQSYDDICPCRFYSERVEQLKQNQYIDEVEAPSESKKQRKQQKIGLEEFETQSALQLIQQTMSASSDKDEERPSFSPLYTRGYNK